MRIIVDCMSGDNAPDAIVHGALEGKAKENVDLILSVTRQRLKNVQRHTVLVLTAVQ